MAQSLSSLSRLIRSIDIHSKENLLQTANNILKKKPEKTTDFFYINSGSIYYLFSDKKFFEAYAGAKHIYLNSFLLEDFIKITDDKNIKKLNAEDFVFDLLQLCEKLGKRIYFLGSDNQSLKKALANLQKKYPKLSIAGHDGYFGDNQSPLEAINKFKPDLLFIGLGLKNQELWVAENREKLKVPVIITIGNFIDILGESRSLPPAFYKRHKIEWFYRFIKEPRRLWKRYLIGGAIILALFIYSIFKKIQNKYY